MTEQNSEQKPILRRFSRRWLLAGLGATALVTAGNALAQEGAPEAKVLPPGLDQLIAGVAGKLGIAPEDLRSAVLETMEESGFQGQFRKHDSGGFRRKWHKKGWWGHAGFIEAASNYVGLERESFAERLRGGETPSQIAEAEGRSRDGLINALLESVRSKLNSMVQEGKLTQEQADSKLSHFDEKIAHWVDGVFQGRKWRHRKPGHEERDRDDIKSSL